MKLLLVEDDSRIAKLILDGLSEDDFVVEHAINASTDESMAALEAFDLLILDVMLPEGHEAGFLLARRLRGNGNKTPVLFLTARADIESKLEGLDSGADDYLAKPFDFRELRARIRALVRRSKGESRNQIRLPAGYVLDLIAHEILLQGQPVALTPREYALLECFALNPNRAFSRSSLIERVWQSQSEVELKAVDVFVSTLRRKLSDQIIETVRGMGYRLGRLG